MGAFGRLEGNNGLMSSAKQLATPRQVKRLKSSIAAQIEQRLAAVARPQRAA